MSNSKTPWNHSRWHWYYWQNKVCSKPQVLQINATTALTDKWKMWQILQYKDGESFKHPTCVVFPDWISSIHTMVTMLSYSCHTSQSYPRIGGQASLAHLRRSVTLQKESSVQSEQLSQERQNNNEQLFTPKDQGQQSVHHDCFAVFLLHCWVYFFHFRGGGWVVSMQEQCSRDEG